jgi:diguanylate cyclase (GGDEF)-like protein
MGKPSAFPTLPSRNGSRESPEIDRIATFTPSGAGPVTHRTMTLFLWVLLAATVAVFLMDSGGAASGAPASVLMVVVPLMAVITSMLALQVSPGRTGWPWVLVTLAAAATLAGQVNWHASAGATGAHHSLINAGAFALLAVALGWMLHQRDRPQPLESGLDSALLLMAATVITLRWSPAAHTILADPAAFTVMERVGTLAAPIAAGCAMMLAGALLLLRTGSRWSTVSVALTVAVACFSIAVAPLALGDGPCCAPNEMSGLAFILGWLCLGFAGLHAARAHELATIAAPVQGGTRLRMMVAPAVATVMAAVVIDSAWRGAMQQLTAVAVGVMGLLLAVRVYNLLVATRSQKAERLQLAQSRALVEVSRALAGTTQLDETLTLVTNWAVDLLDARAAAIELLTPDGVELELRASCGLPDSALYMTFPVEGSFTGWVVRHRKPRTAVDARLDPFIHSATRELLGDAPLAAAPLQCRGVALGALACIGRHPFRHEDIQLLGALADQAAVAIENARLFHQVHRLSVTDPLTGLANRRHLERDITREFASAGRGRRLALVMFDLDGFKAFNDRHGHLAGDDALRAFATALIAETRASNLAVRYGGDEFIVLLADSDCDGAEAFIHRVTDRFAVSDGSRYGGELSVSAGIAEYQPEMKRPEDLIAAADRALYRIKARR